MQDVCFHCEEATCIEEFCFCHWNEMKLLSKFKHKHLKGTRNVLVKKQFWVAMATVYVKEWMSARIFPCRFFVFPHFYRFWQWYQAARCKRSLGFQGWGNCCCVYIYSVSSEIWVLILNSSWEFTASYISLDSKLKFQTSWVTEIPLPVYEIFQIQVYGHIYFWILDNFIYQLFQAKALYQSFISSCTLSPSYISKPLLSQVELLVEKLLTTHPFLVVELLITHLSDRIDRIRSFEKIRYMRKKVPSFYCSRSKHNEKD